jgi:COMPASS component SWD3
VSGSFDEAVFLWDVRRASVMRALPAHSDPVGGVDFLRDGSMVCSCAGDGLIRIWDALTGQCLKTLVHEDRKPVTNVRFTPNGQFVVAWTLDNCIRLWRYTEGRCVKTYQGHTNEQYSISGCIGEYMNGQEAFVVSGSEEGDVVAWDVSTKEVLWRGKEHRQPVLAVDFCRLTNGKGLLVSGGLDRDLRVWIEVDEDGKEISTVATETEEIMVDRGRLEGSVLTNGVHVEHDDQEDFDMDGGP